MTIENRKTDLFEGYGIQVTLKDPEDFLKVRETLTRIGIASHKDQKLYQSCHILHKRGFYAILHFKELFALDRKPSSLTDEDVKRRNAIAKLLEEWKLVGLISQPDPDQIGSLASIKILTFSEKKDWICEAKYAIGKRRI